jgi:hypothetical protein
MGDVIAEMDKVLLHEDIVIFHDFLAHGQQELAIEFACDRTLEHGFVISEKLGQMLLVLCGKLGLSPYRTWRAIWVERPPPEGRDRLRVEGADLLSPIVEIFLKFQDRLDSGWVDQIQFFLVNEDLDLAIEDIYSCFVENQIPISKRDVDTIRSTWLDLGRDPAELKDFVLKEEQGPSSSEASTHAPPH